METGWLGEAPEEVPALPVTEMLLDRQQRRAAPLETALARSAADDRRAAREAAANAPDPDERAANLVARGYTPGLLFQLTQRLGDTTAELEAERDKVEKGRRRQERIARDHAAGRIGGFDVARMMQDFDEGDQGLVERLERRAEGLRRQIGEAQEAICPPQRRDLDPVESATRAAHEVFREVTRARMAEAQARVPARPPFDGSSVSRGAGDGTEHTGPDCQVCAEARRRDAARDRAAFAAVYGEIAR